MLSVVSSSCFQTRTMCICTTVPRTACSDAACVLSVTAAFAYQGLRVGGVKGWTKERIDNVVASAKTSVVNLREPLPVHITYLTAWVDDGVANFRQDIYGHDAKLLAALEGKSIAW